MPNESYEAQRYKFFTNLIEEYECSYEHWKRVRVNPNRGYSDAYIDERCTYLQKAIFYLTDAREALQPINIEIKGGPVDSDTGQYADNPVLAPAT